MATGLLDLSVGFRRPNRPPTSIATNAHRNALGSSPDRPSLVMVEPIEPGIAPRGEVEGRQGPARRGNEGAAHADLALAHSSAPADAVAVRCHLRRARHGFGARIAPPASNCRTGRTYRTKSLASPDRSGTVRYCSSGSAR